jgi:hypothetical protein
MNEAGAAKGSNAAAPVFAPGDSVGCLHYIAAAAIDGWAFCCQPRRCLIRPLTRRSPLGHLPAQRQGVGWAKATGGRNSDLSLHSPQYLQGIDWSAECPFL